MCMCVLVERLMALTEIKCQKRKWILAIIGIHLTYRNGNQAIKPLFKWTENMNVRVKSISMHQLLACLYVFVLF